MMDTKIVVTGGSGMVGQALKKIMPNAIYLSSKDCDLTDLNQTILMIKKYEPDTIIHIAGDLYVFFEEENHEFFSRYGNDVLLQVVLGYSQAVFGDKIDIPTINGTAKLKIPTGIQPGQILRVKGKGFPLIGKSRRGDQLVKIQIEVPSKLGSDEKKSIEDLLKIQRNKKIKFQRFED